MFKEYASIQELVSKVSEITQVDEPQIDKGPCIYTETTNFKNVIEPESKGRSQTLNNYDQQSYKTETFTS